MPDRRQVDADLVGAPGHEVELEEGPALEALAHAVARHARAAVRDDGHPRPVPRIAPDGRFDAAVRGADRAGYQRQVRLLDAASLELRHQVGLGRIVAGDHDQAARVPVEAMDDAWPRHAGDAPEALSPG
jgi:hypothetical protein